LFAGGILRFFLRDLLQNSLELGRVVVIRARVAVPAVGKYDQYDAAARFALGFQHLAQPGLDEVDLRLREVELACHLVGRHALIVELGIEQLERLVRGRPRGVGGRIGGVMLVGEVPAVGVPGIVHLAADVSSLYVQEFLPRVIARGGVVHLRPDIRVETGIFADAIRVLSVLEVGVAARLIRRACAGECDQGEHQQVPERCRVSLRGRGRGVLRSYP
jgi:hypothetical protein